MGKKILIQYFYNRLKTLVELQVDKNDYNQNNWNKIVQKFIHIETMINYQSFLIFYKINAYYSQSYRFYKLKNFIKHIEAKNQLYLLNKLSIGWFKLLWLYNSIKKVP